MKKTPAQIAKDKLDSNNRKANARVNKASDELDKAKDDPNAGTKAGQRTINQKRKVLHKAQGSLAHHERESLKDVTSSRPVPPKKGRGKRYL